MIIAIDFDGTIVDHEFPNIGKLKGEVVAFMRQLKRDGHDIIIWTCRTSQNDFPNGEPTIFHVEQFLRKHNIPFDTINNNISHNPFHPSPKVYADIYIDDRNLGGLPMKGKEVDWVTIYNMIRQETLRISTERLERIRKEILNKHKTK